MTKNDKCFSTALNGHNPFNKDGQERTELTIEEARTAFDYEIKSMPCYDGTGREIPNLYHIESDDGIIIPCHGVTKGFTPINHRDVFDYITAKVMPEIPEMKLEMAGTIRGRSVGVFAAKFGDTFAIKGDKSPQELRLFFSNPTNGTGTMVMGFTTVRVVCQNTLLAATKKAKSDGFEIYHTKNANIEIMGAAKMIREQAVAALEIKRRCEALAEIGVDGETLRRALDAVYPLHQLPEDSSAYARMNNLREGVIRQFEDGETAQTMSDKRSAWALFNSFTYPIFNPDEKKLAKSKTKDKAEIAYKGMNGNIAEKVGVIFRKVEQVVR